MGFVSKKRTKDSDPDREFYEQIKELKLKFESSYTDLNKELEKLKQEFEAKKEAPVSAKLSSKDTIPLSVLKTSALSSLEAITKYLREDCNLNFREIGELLNRSQFTIASSYKSASTKLAERLSVEPSEYDIPTAIIADRKLSVLESIVSYLKGNFRLKFSEIASLLNLDQRTIWTVYSRARKKNER